MLLAFDVFAYPVRMKKIVSIVLSGIAVLVVAALVVPWVYINWIRDDPPVRLSLDTIAVVGTDANSAADPTGVEGEWKVGPDSTVGYRVKEILLGQDSEGVGRSNSVTGLLAINGNQVNSAEFSVEVASIQSDSSRRDGQFKGPIMDAASFPTAKFTLTAPITLTAEAIGGAPSRVVVTGDLTLRGTTKSVSFPIDARFENSTIQVVGSIEVLFSDWGIANPSNTVVTTEDKGLLEFLLTFTR